MVLKFNDLLPILRSIIMILTSNQRITAFFIQPITSMHFFDFDFLSLFSFLIFFSFLLAGRNIVMQLSNKAVVMLHDYWTNSLTLSDT